MENSALEYSTMSAFVAIQLSEAEVEDRLTNRSDLGMKSEVALEKFFSILDLMELLDAEFLVVEAAISDYFSCAKSTRQGKLYTYKTLEYLKGLGLNAKEESKVIRCLICLDVLMPEKIERVVSAFKKAFSLSSVQEMLNKGRSLFMPMPNMTMVESSRATVILLANTVKKGSILMPSTDEAFTINIKISNLLQWITAVMLYT
eukprot:2492877-Amphidinium_carterae.1